MRSYPASLTSDQAARPAAGRVAQQDGVATPAAFDAEIAAAIAAQVFADDLASMWAGRHDAISALPGAGASDRRALIASLGNRADRLALRATAAAARPGAAGGFAQAAMMIRDLAARRLPAEDAIAPRPAGRRASPIDVSGSAT